MKVIVAGSRGFQKEEWIFDLLDNSPYEITQLVSGHAIGVDQIGETWAKHKGIPTVLFIPHYTIDTPRIAPLLRNNDMADYAEALIAVWDGESHGTKHMIDQMRKRGKPYKIYYTRSPKRSQGGTL